MGRIIGLVSIKGGVGKTTIASSLASDLVNHFGKKVLLVDANYSAPNLGLHMDIVEPKITIHNVLAGNNSIADSIHSSYGVDVIPGSYVFDKEINFMKLKDKLAKIKDDYDYVILDSSPSLNEEVLSTILASDSLFVVTTPDYPTMSCSLKAAKLAKQRGKPIAGIIINKVKDPQYELNLDEIEQTLSIPVVAKIPDERSANRALFTRIPLSIYHRYTPYSKEISALSSVLTNTPEKRSLFGFLFPNKFKKEAINRQVLRKHFYSSMFGDN